MALTLAITKIGDLLFQKRITKGMDGKPITPVSLKIPVYQRPYKWKGKNAIQLLDDIVEARNENKEVYRVGTLILHSNKGMFDIVDGQQRIITFSLLLKSFLMLLERHEEMAFLDEKMTDNPYNVQNISSNFRAFRRRIDGIVDQREKEGLFGYIKDNCELIVVITDDQSEAFQFFDSQNSRGKPLYPHDLLKAYHLREMQECSVETTERVVKQWEDMDQKSLSSLFSDYLFSLKKWIKGNPAPTLTEHNIQIFKGITRHADFPYAQFFKGAFAYAEMVNNSPMPYVSGSRNLKPFQIDAPIIAGKPFFDYAKHYFDILMDIQNNDKYSGYFINDNNIVKTLDLPKYKNGKGNTIVRLLFDTTVLLYVDRFCPERPSKIDLEMLDQFVVLAFIWAYSLRAQYYNLGWPAAQNYILENNDVYNSFNIYKAIAGADSPVALFGELADRIATLPMRKGGKEIIKSNQSKDDIDAKNPDGVYQNYLGIFKQYNFIILEKGENNDEK